MSFDYINEAFKRLDLLTEETFDTSLNGINSLADFMEQDDTVDTIKVIDPEADTETELKDSYIGKVITNCNVCHSHIFNNKEDVAIDNDGNVNTEVQCPYCGEMAGFTVVGEITEYKPESDETEEGSDPTVEVDGEEVPVEEPSEEPLEEAVTGPKHYKPHTRRLLKLIGSDLLNEDTESLTEEVNNVNVETDDSIVNVHTDDSGKVVVSTEPKATGVDETEEMIAPLSDETMNELEANNDIITDDVPTEEVPEDDVIDMDFEEVDEEGLDELGESYLKNVYENVDSFKTTSISTNSTQMIVEGLIKFTSGTTKKTGFIFEAKDASKDGSVRFIGENTQLSKGKKAFTLAGKISENKLLPESLSYNYRIKNSEGKFNRIHGTISRNKE